MNCHFTYRIHRTPSIENNIQHGIQKLARRLQAYRPELVHLKGAIEEHSGREGVCVCLNLRLPSQMEAPWPPASIGRACGRGFLR